MPVEELRTWLILFGFHDVGHRFKLEWINDENEEIIFHAGPFEPPISFRAGLDIRAFGTLDDIFTFLKEKYYNDKGGS